MSLAPTGSGKSLHAGRRTWDKMNSKKKALPQQKKKNHPRGSHRFCIGHKKATISAAATHADTTHLFVGAAGTRTGARRPKILVEKCAPQTIEIALELPKPVTW